MFHRFHDRFGTAGVVIAVIALVVALGGTALAAGKLNGTQKKEVEKIAKKFAGKPGANGAAGAPGEKGAPGANGTNGTNGTNGKSVAVAAEPEGENCEQGGIKVEVEGSVASKKYVCNGAPWTAGGTLPDEATETGTWSVPEVVLIPGLYTTESEYLVPIDFTIPVTPAPVFTFVPNAPGGGFGTATGCPGVVGGLPQAASGRFCVYGVGIKLGLNEYPSGTGVTTSDPTDIEQGEPGVTPAGTLLKVKCTGGLEGACSGKGLWAVTG
jgi:hypothetical protein